MGNEDKAINYITYIPHPRVRYRHHGKASRIKEGSEQTLMGNDRNQPMDESVKGPSGMRDGDGNGEFNSNRVPYLKLYPTTDDFAILNLPLLPQTYKIAFMIEAKFAKQFHGARIVFTDTKAMGSFTSDDVRYPHRNLLEGFNETRVFVPKENEGVHPNRVHYFSKDPIMGNLKVYDMKKIFPDDERFFQLQGDEIERTSTYFGDSTDQFKTMVYEIYRGGKDWRDELNRWAEKYGAESVVREACWPTEQPREEPAAAEFLKTIVANNAHEIRRNQAMYSELMDTQGWVSDEVHSNLMIREKQLKLDMEENMRRFRHYLQLREEILIDKHRWSLRISVFVVLLQIIFVLFILKSFPGGSSFESLRGEER